MEDQNQNQEPQSAEQETVSAKEKVPKQDLNLKLLIGGAIVLSLILSLGVVLYFNWSQKGSQATPERREEKQLPTEETVVEPQTVEEVEKAVDELQSELDTLDQIEEELNSPELDLDLGL